MHIGYMPRERDPHFQPYISAQEHIIFTNDKKILLQSITILHFFAAPETIIFKITLR